MKKWIKQKEKKVFNGRIFTLKDIECYHPDKKVTHDFFVLNTYDWINVVALTEDNKFLMVKQHRIGTDKITIETPGGVIEKSETPENTAIRELLEETGYKAEKISLLKKLSTNPAIINNYIYFYLAKDCKKIAEQNLDKAEDIEVLTYTQDEVIEMIQDGTIDHSIVITALSLYFILNNCKKLKIF